MFLHLFCRDSAGDLVTTQKQACSNRQAAKKEKKEKKVTIFLGYSLPSALSAK